jgi:hypothetical protein
MTNSNKPTRLTEAHVNAQVAAMEEFGDELQRETLRCEHSTAEAIGGAQNSQKLSQLYSGLEVWKKALSTSATRYYKTCFELGRKNMDDLGGKNPADFAYERAATGLSLFLRVSALDGREESLDGCVREFVRHVCGDWSDVRGNSADVLDDSAPTPVFQLPWWAVPRGIGARMAGLPMKPPNGDESSTLGIEESETFILSAHSSLTAELRAVLSRSHRKALIAIGMSTLSSSKQGPPVAPVATNMADLATSSESEHLDALNRLNRLFGSELWRAKADTSAVAFESLRAIDTDSAKRDELEKHFLAWRERVAAAIHKWVGKYLALARSSPAVAGSAGKWVEEQVLSSLRAQCMGYEGRSTFTKDGVTYLEPLEWWLRCACDGKPRLPERPWDPPDWIVPIYDSQLLHHASLTRELMSELDAAIVDAFQVGTEREAPDRSARRVDPTTEFVDRAMRQMDRGSRLIDNFRLEQQEQHRREMERLNRDIERARELEHARKLAEIKRPETPAGVIDDSALRRSVASDVTGDTNEPGNRFEKQGDTWAITFAGETCRLAAPLIGLDYILILLQNPGRSMRGLELQTVLAGNPIASRPAGKLVADDVTVDARTDTDEDECSLSFPGHSSGDEQLDPKAIRQYKERLKDLERDATNAYNLSDNAKGDELQKQYDEIESRLKQSFDIHHRPRVFSDDNEKARISITRALKRAYNKIRLQAPKTARHMESNIKTGSEFVYLDNSLSWKL